MNTFGSNDEYQQKKNAAAVRAERVERLRNLMNMSSWKQLAYKHGDLLNYNTIRGWGSKGGGNGLSEKGAWALVEVAAREGVQCTFEWLYYGIGVGPSLTRKLEESAQILFDPRQFSPKPEQKQIWEEAKVFKQHHPKAVVLEVYDQGMTPLFNVGDYVGGGKKISQTHYYTSAIGLHC